MRCEGWRSSSIVDMVSFSPRETLPKNKLAKKVAMEKLSPFQKAIDGFELSNFNGGTKFRNGDTLLARITPCLENGKTAKVSILEEGEVGFGSSEYIVMRNKPGITDADFVYYLATSPAFRELAIKSMVGTSGRQRVQQDLIESAVMSFPPLPEQRAIAATLSCLDDKIELNNRMNKTLEEMAQAIFKSWFVDFEPFQDGEFVDSELGRIPKGWRVGTLGEIASITTGKRPSERVEKADLEHSIPVAGASGIMAYTRESQTDGDVIITGRVGTHGILQRYSQPIWVSDNAFIFKSSYLEYTYQVLSCVDFASLNVGSTQPLITQSALRNVKVLVPSSVILSDYESLANNFYIMTASYRKQNEQLATIRDSLLPKLMNGEIRVPTNP